MCQESDLHQCGGAVDLLGSFSKLSRTISHLLEFFHRSSEGALSLLVRHGSWLRALSTISLSSDPSWRPIWFVVRGFVLLRRPILKAYIGLILAHGPMSFGPHKTISHNIYTYIHIYIYIYKSILNYAC